MNTCEQQQTYHQPSSTPYDSFHTSPMDYTTTATITSPFNDLHRTLYCKTQSREPQQQQKQQQQQQEYTNLNLDNHERDHNHTTTNHNLNDPTESRHPRRKSVLDISSLLCNFASTSVHSPSNSDASLDDDDDDSSTSNLGDTESMDSPRHLESHDASSTPGSSPPLSPDVPNGRDFSSYNYEQTIGGADPHYQNNQKVYYADEPGFCDDAKRPQHRDQVIPSQNSPPQIVLPSIRSLPDLRSEFVDREEMSRPFSPSSQLPSINLDSPKPWNQMQRLEQLAVISEVYHRSDHYQQELPRYHVLSKPFSSPSLASMYHDHDHEREQLLRRSSIATPSPYPSARLPPFLDQRRHSDSPMLHNVRNQAEQKRSSAIGWEPRHLHSNPPYTIPDSSSAIPHHALIQHHQLYAPYHDPSSPNGPTMIKAKRKRANAGQLKVLNQVFQHTFFPSTELRIQLGKQLGMSPRTVQIWFQNKRQSWRSKTRAVTGENGVASANEGGQDDQGHNNENGNNDPGTNSIVSRRSSNSSLNSSSDEDQDQRSIPDSPLDGLYSSRSDYFGNENTSSALQHQNGGYFHRNYNDHVRQPFNNNQLPNNERLPSIVSSFAYSSSSQPRHHTDAISTNNNQLYHHYHY